MQLLETTFCEAIKPDQINRETGVIQRVRLLGHESKNGPAGGKRLYSEAAMTKAASLYEGRKVYIDHPDRKTPGAERKFESFAGEIKNAAYSPSDNAVYGDFWVLKSHRLSGAIFESAERFPRNFGFSHNANGRARKDGPNELVEDLHDVVSCDVVTQPATNKGLFESVSEQPMNKTIKQIIEAVDKKTPGHAGLVSLVEQEPSLAEMPVEMPEEAPDADEEIKAAFKQAAKAAIDDDSLDTTATLAKIKTVLKAQDKVVGGEEENPAEPAESESESEEEVSESMQVLQSKFAKLEATNMLLESGRDANEHWVNALALTPEANRKALLESFPVKQGGKGRKPERSQPLRESQNNDDRTRLWDARVARARQTA